MITRFAFAIAVLVCSQAALSPAGEIAANAQWPRWRGPQDNGSTTVGSYSTEFNASKNVLWKTSLPGTGCSTPTVSKGNILLTCPADGQDTVINFDWDGKVKWRAEIGSQIPGKHRNGSGSNPSVVIDDDRLFAYFKSGNLAELDPSGKIVWQTNLKKFAKDTLFWDLGTSPITTKQCLVVAVMHNGESFLVAYEKGTGKQKWYVSRNYKTPVEGDHSYATPIVTDHMGMESILVWGAEHLTAHDAVNGELIWSCGGFNPDGRGNWVAVGSHVIAGDIAIVPYGRGSRLAGIKLGGEGDVTETHRLWTRKDTGSFVPTPLVHNGRVYVLRDRGEVECIDPKTGKTLWKDALPKHRAKYYASPVVAGDHLYAAREDGVVFVAGIKGEFKLVSENDMGERLIASPVPVANRLLIRGAEHLFCIGSK
ncbi:MAG: PQQ-binding-like beta-propeller repeat protein [Pirellulales bacterium]